ncbi:MAG: oxidoreductase, partial [Calditrichaceae bacterium]
MGQKKENCYSSAEIDQCISVLNHLITHSEDFVALPREKQIELMKIAGQISRPDSHQIKQRRKASRENKKQKIVSKERKARA